MRGRQFLIPHASRDDDALLASCRSGDLNAARRLTQRHQRELLHLAYLLTGDASRAADLASETLIGLLANPPEQLDQPASYLALDLAKRYFRNPSRSTWLDQSGPEHYNVDDEQSRTKESLDRLEPLQRATLVLSQVAGIPERQIRGALGRDDRRDQRSTVDQARGRVALATGRAADAPIIDLLNRLLVDAPTADLRPDIEEPITRAWSARRRSERMLTVAAIVIVLIAIGGTVIWLGGFPSRSSGDESQDVAALPARTEPTAAEKLPSPTEARASFAAAPTISMPDGSVVTVQDLQLLRVFEWSGEGRSALASYDPAANTSTPLLAAGGQPLISPDGRWIISNRELADPPGMSLLTGGSLDGDATWESQLAIPRAIAIGNDHIYVMNLQTPDSYQIQVIDLTSGEIINSWPIAEQEVIPATLRVAKLILSQDDDRLALLSARVDQAQSRWLRALAVYQPDTGELIDEFALDEPRTDGSTDFDIDSSRPLPGEDVLYSIVEDEYTSHVRLQFLDLRSGTLSSLLLPLEARSVLVAERLDEREIFVAPSNTGAVLYVVQTRQREVAVVDMRSRSLIGVFPLTAGEADRTAFETNLSHVSYMKLLLSPDGTRLYLLVNHGQQLPYSGFPTQSPVWAIDTTTWEVAERWTVSGMPRRMTMDGDGSHLYVRSTREDGTVFLTTISTATGETVGVQAESLSPDWTKVSRLTSVTQLYHDQYGVRPRTGPAAPVDNPALAVLPGVSVEVEGAVAGVEVDLTVRIVHPLTGELATTDRTLRFDPNATVAIELSNGQERAIIVPASVEPGVYRAPLRLNAAGIWDARVTVINRDGTSWTAEQPGAIKVEEGLTGRNGGAYRFLVRPANPVNRRTITLRVWMVESRSGERLPEEIEFLDQISEDARIILTHPSGERIDEPLVRVDQSSFMGWVRFGAAGEWSARIVLGMGNGERVAIDAGTIEINDLTEPYRRTYSTPAGGQIGD